MGSCIWKVNRLISISLKVALHVHDVYEQPISWALLKLDLCTDLFIGHCPRLVHSSVSNFVLCFQGGSLSAHLEGNKEIILAHNWVILRNSFHKFYNFSKKLDLLEKNIAFWMIKTLHYLCYWTEKSTENVLTKQLIRYY